MSATVEAFVYVRAYTYEIWLSQMPSAAAPKISGMSRRRTRNERSTPYVNHVKRIVAMP
jgi:hypothetical protein